MEYRFTVTIEADSLEEINEAYEALIASAIDISNSLRTAEVVIHEGALPEGNTLTYLDVSTAHLTDLERRHVSLLPQALAHYDEGAFYYVGGDNPVVELEGEASPTFVAIMGEAFRRGCSLVRFDADGMLLEGFPTFEGTR